MNIISKRIHLANHSILIYFSSFRITTCNRKSMLSNDTLELTYCDVLSLIIRLMSQVHSWSHWSPIEALVVQSVSWSWQRISNIPWRWQIAVFKMLDRRKCSKVIYFSLLLISLQYQLRFKFLALKTQNGFFWRISNVWLQVF